MRTNEELALMVQRGDKDAVGALWEQTKKLIFKYASSYFRIGKERGFEPDDLLQEGFFALVRAINYYDPQKNILLSTYLSYCVKSAIRAALGLRTGREVAPQPLSLDEQIAGDSDYPIYRFDAIEDAPATYCMEQVEHELYLSQLRAVLLPALESMTPQMRRALQCRYWGNKSHKQVADELGVSRQRTYQLECGGLAALRRSKYMRQLESFIYN